MTNALKVSWIVPASGKGELTFSVVDTTKKQAIALYPASQLDNGANSTQADVLGHFLTERTPTEP